MTHANIDLFHFRIKYNYLILRKCLFCNFLQIVRFTVQPQDVKIFAFQLNNWYNSIFASTTARTMYIL